MRTWLESIKSTFLSLDTICSDSVWPFNPYIMLYACYHQYLYRCDMYNLKSENYCYCCALFSLIDRYFESNIIIIRLWRRKFVHFSFFEKWFATFFSTLCGSKCWNFTICFKLNFSDIRINWWSMFSVTCSSTQNEHQLTSYKQNDYYEY